MEKQIKSGFFIAWGVASLMFYAHVQAATIPPGNPFYVVQNGVRSLRRAFTFSPANKAMLEIRLVNERMADVEAVRRINPDPAAHALAREAYQEEIDVLVSAAKGIYDERVIDAVLEVVVSHGVRLSGIPEHDALFMKVVAMPRAVFGEQAGSIIRTRLGKAVATQSDAFKELRGLELLNAIERENPTPELVKDIERVKDDVAALLMGRVKRGDVVFEGRGVAPANPLVHFQALEEVRMKSMDLETRNALTRVREQVLVEYGADRRVGAALVREALEYAKMLSLAAGVKQEQSIYFVEQAEKFLSDTAYMIAFQYAISADIAVNNAVLLTTITKKDLREEVAMVKKQYDALAIKPAGMEKRIAGIADAIGRTPASETLAALRDIKLMIASASF